MTLKREKYSKNRESIETLHKNLTVLHIYQENLLNYSPNVQSAKTITGLSHPIAVGNSETNTISEKHTPEHTPILTIQPTRETRK
jgi:hypothetical protein